MDPAPHRSSPSPQVQLRPGRAVAAGAAAVVTLVALLGGLGMIPVDPAGAAVRKQVTPSTQHLARRPTGQSAGQPDGLPTAHSRRTTIEDVARTKPAPLPAASGTGRRVVFSISAQRVWLVNPAARKKVRRTYLVSGSVTDNLKPGTYEVYSRSEHAFGIDDSGTMEWFVRFAHGQNAAIGFHDIPVKDGKMLQTRADLGTPQSHGCIRQWEPDAKAMWRFAQTGTTVVVVA
jgi:lipoprotein-anchoring transpeptidase ErfK/SrfK